jgi:hypothetical protein
VPDHSAQLAFCDLMSKAMAAELLREESTHGARALLRSFVAGQVAGNCDDKPGTSYGSNP